MNNQIHLTGVKTHNLKNLSLTIPLHALSVVTGPSGSGKSSLVFDTIFSEAQRRYLESLSAYARQFVKALPKPDVLLVENLPPAVSVKQGRYLASKTQTVAALTQLSETLPLLFVGLGARRCLNCQTVVPSYSRDKLWQEILAAGLETTVSFLVELTVFEKIAAQDLIFYLRASGFSKLWFQDHFVDIDALGIDYQKAYLLIDRLKLNASNEDRFKQAVDLSYKVGKDAFFLLSDKLTSYCRLGSRCPNCLSRYEALGLGQFSVADRQIELLGQSIAEVLALDLGSLRAFVRAINLNNFAEGLRLLEPWQETLAQLDLLCDLGLFYLTADRFASTLSGGELSRILLSRCIGLGLSETLYCLDEPCASLHVKDREKVIAALRNLCRDNNTVICVEHDWHMIKAADHIIEIGPFSGHLGGELVFTGNATDYEKDPKHQQAMPKSGISTALGQIILQNIKAQNLQIAELSVPLGQLVVVCGVSGSGKSTLVREVLYPLLCYSLPSQAKAAKNQYASLRIQAAKDLPLSEVHYMGQNEGRRSQRSIVASFLGVIDSVRKLLAQEDRALDLGLTPKSFGFNSPGGRCETCAGLGVIDEDLAFLGHMQVICPSCEGERFQKPVLEVKFQGKNIIEILALTVDQACDFFARHPKMAFNLGSAAKLGLGYLTLAQDTLSLSAGELQRLRLLTYLKERKKGQIFLFDEASYGLSRQDIRKMLDFFFMLIAEGNTIVLVEHHLDVIQAADYVLELGPKAGKDGGKLLYAGHPLAIKDVSESVIKDYLTS